LGFIDHVLWVLYLKIEHWVLGGQDGWMLFAGQRGGVGRHSLAILWAMTIEVAIAIGVPSPPWLK